MTLKAVCGSCGCPDQHVGLSCGFCGTTIQSTSAVAPDGTARVEEVIGYRGWKIQGRDRGTGSDIRLISPLFSQNDVWEPGQWMIAKCHRHRPPTPNGNAIILHTPDNSDPSFWPPVKGCGGTGHGCGFYAARTREHLVGTLGQYVRYEKDCPSVIGQVQMAGKIILASNGFRAQKVRPRVLYVPFELWEIGRDLKLAYEPFGVEVKMETTIVLPADGDGSLKWCVKCKAKMNRTALCGFCGHRHT